MPYGAVGRYTEPTIVPPDIQEKYQDYNVFDLARELGQFWLKDLQKAMSIVPIEDVEVPERISDIPEEKIQRALEIGLAAEAGILGGVKGAKALGKLAKHPFPKSVVKEPVYHGTIIPEGEKDFGVLFDIQRKDIYGGPTDPGVHFGTSTAAEARITEHRLHKYAKEEQKIPSVYPYVYTTQGTTIKPAFLDIRNPIRLPDDSPLSKGFGWKWRGIYRKLLEKKLVPKNEDAMFKREKAKEVVEKYFKDNKIDGIVYKNTYENIGKDSYIVFKQSQIKSVFEKPQSPLKKAILDTHRGADPEKVWKETGWTKDPSGKWMFRIDDSKMKMFEPEREFRVKPLNEVIDHPELFKAYPELKEMNVTMAINPKEVSKGSYNAWDMISVNAPDAKAAKKSLIHEIQHAIQEREGFVQGGDVKSDIAIKYAQDKLNKQLAPIRKEMRSIYDSILKEAKLKGVDEDIIWEKYPGKDKRWRELDKRVAKIGELPTSEMAFEGYRRLPGEIYAREEAEGFKGMPGTMEKIPRKDWIVRKGMAEMSRKRR